MLFVFDEWLYFLRGRKFAMVKIENLARINEEDGYPAGDLVLKRVAHEILANVRIIDTVIHYKGNKFAVQFEDMDSEEYQEWGEEHEELEDLVDEVLDRLDELA